MDPIALQNVSIVYASQRSSCSYSCVYWTFKCVNYCTAHQLRDYTLVYNRLTSRCFGSCVRDFTRARLTAEEVQYHRMHDLSIVKTLIFRCNYAVSSRTIPIILITHLGFGLWWYQNMCCPCMQRLCSSDLLENEYVLELIKPVGVANPNVAIRTVYRDTLTKCLCS